MSSGCEMSLSMLRRLRRFAALAVFGCWCAYSQGFELRNIEVADETEIDIRVFAADGGRLLLGFACDEGAGPAEEVTAAQLAMDGIEVWMPDMLSAYMLPKMPSSVRALPTASVLSIIRAAQATGKQVYLIGSGADSELILRAAASAEALGGTGATGAVLFFPRLHEGKPEPGVEPKYVAAVGATKLPLIVLEGERTPNRWGLKHLTQALGKGGSKVHSKLIPEVRGYFFKRDDPTMPEAVVSSQLAGLVKASLFYLGRATDEPHSK